MKPGDEIGSWVVEDRLGAGGMGSVYRCHNKHAPAIKAALKVLTTGASAGTARRFQREAEVLAKLDHPAIVRVRDFQVHEGRPFLVMSLIEGMPLHKLRVRTKLDEAAVVSIGTQIADALAHAHQQQVFHRDIKPANCLVRPDGGVVIVDFGIALDAQQARMTQTSKLSPATYYYAPPEWLSAHDPNPVSWDVYSLGLVLFELLLMRRAFSTEKMDTPLETVEALFDRKRAMGALDPGPDFDEAMRVLIEMMTHPDEGQRIASMDVARDRLVQRCIDLTSTLPHRAGGADVLEVARAVLAPRVQEAFEAEDDAESVVVSMASSSAPRVIGGATAARIGPAPDPSTMASLRSSQRKRTRRIEAITRAVQTLNEDLPRIPTAADVDIGIDAALEGGARVVSVVGPNAVAACRAWIDATLAPGEAATCALRGARTEALVAAAVADGLGLRGAADDTRLEHSFHHCQRLLLLEAPPAAAPLAAVLGRWMERNPDLRVLVAGLEPLGLPGEAFVELGAVVSTPGAPDPSGALERATVLTLESLGPKATPTFARLAVFEGSFGADAVAALPGASADPELLAQLADQGIIDRLTGLDGTPRYALEPAMRELAWRRLGDVERAPIEDGIDGWLAGQIADLDLDLLRFGGPVAGARGLLDNRANLVAALQRAIANGDRARGARLGTAVAGIVLATGTAAAALALIDQVLDSLEPSPSVSRRLVLQRARALSALGRMDEAQQAAAEAGEAGWAARDRRLVALAMGEEAKALHGIGSLDEAVGRLKSAIELIENDGAPIHRAWLLLQLARVQAGVADRSAQGEILDRALAAVADSDALLLEARVHLALGRHWSRSQDVERARLHLGAARDLARAVNGPGLEAEALMVWAGLQLAAGRLLGAGESLSEALTLARGQGAVMQIARCSGELGQVRRLQGDLPGARRLLEAALRLEQEAGSGLGAAVATGNLGDLALEQGQIDEARALLLRSVARLDELGAHEALGALLGPLGEAEARAGDVETGRWHLECGETLLRGTGAADFLILLLCHRGQVELLGDDTEAAGSALGEARALLRALGHAAGSELGRRVERLARALA